MGQIKVFLNRLSEVAEGYATVEMPGRKRRGCVRWQLGQAPRVGIPNSTPAERKGAAFAVLGALMERYVKRTAK